MAPNTLNDATAHPMADTIGPACTVFLRVILEECERHRLDGHMTTFALAAAISTVLDRFVATAPGPTLLERGAIEAHILCEIAELSNAERGHGSGHLSPRFIAELKDLRDKHYLDVARAALREKGADQ